jgi:hypothetical protein
LPTVVLFKQVSCLGYKGPERLSVWAISSPKRYQPA